MENGRLHECVDLMHGHQNSFRERPYMTITNMCINRLQFTAHKTLYISTKSAQVENTGTAQCCAALGTS